MRREHGPWTVHKTARPFHNPFFTVHQDQVTQPDGQPGEYATVSLKPGVAVLPIDSDGQVFLTRQFRYAVGRKSIEASSGSAQGDEPAVEAARRETREELGIEADKWIDLGLIDLDTSIVHCPVHLFIARGLSFTETEREGTETIETVQLSLLEAVRMVMNGTITHAASCVLILKAQMLQAASGSPC